MSYNPREGRWLTEDDEWHWYVEPPHRSHIRRSLCFKRSELKQLREGTDGRKCLKCTTTLEMLSKLEP